MLLVTQSSSNRNIGLITKTLTVDIRGVCFDLCTYLVKIVITKQKKLKFYLFYSCDSFASDCQLTYWFDAISVWASI